MKKYEVFAVYGKYAINVKYGKLVVIKQNKIQVLLKT